MRHDGWVGSLGIFLALTMGGCELYFGHPHAAPQDAPGFDSGSDAFPSNGGDDAPDGGGGDSGAATFRDSCEEPITALELADTVVELQTATRSVVVKGLPETQHRG